MILSTILSVIALITLVLVSIAIGFMFYLSISLLWSKEWFGGVLGFIALLAGLLLVMLWIILIGRWCGVDFINNSNVLWLK